MADYSEEIATALELISEFGSTVTLRTPTSTVPDPDTPWRVIESEPDDTPAKAVVVWEGDVRNCYIAASGLDVIPDDETVVVLPSGEVCKFANNSIKALEPAGDGQVILYQGSLVQWPG